MPYNSKWLTTSCILVLCFYFGLTELLSKEDSRFSTDIAKEPDARLLLFSTLDGTLAAINQQTGHVLWRIKDKPSVTVPLDTRDAIIPLFLPDPRDGSLYLLGNSREPLKKLPFTIPQLVASSPCRSSDGILYTGKKKDTWFTLDPRTGQKQQVLGWDTMSSTCPLQSEDAVYVGRTQYSIMMVDSRNTQRKWNVTFYDYSSNPLGKEMLQNYELVHFASTSTGRVLTLDRRRGTLLWDEDLTSPVVAIYLMDSEGLLNVPFTSMANHTIGHLADELLNNVQPLHQPTQMKLYPTLYVGEHMYGLYALPSLVDQNMVTITASEAGPLLLEGPDAPKCPRPYPEYPVPGQSYHIPTGITMDPLTFQNIPYTNYTIVYLGHYNTPEYTASRLMISGQNIVQIKLITDESSTEVHKVIEESKDTKNRETPPLDGIPTFRDETSSYRIIGLLVQQSFKHIKRWINQQENKGLKLTLIILIGCIIAMFWYLQMQVREFQQMSQNGSRSSHTNSVGRNGAVTAVIEELPDGLVRIGKITFHPEQLLGKGCEGTFVYRGEFDKRQVAVKRLLPECFTFADREVALLRESDAHPNVIRYFCTEQDRMFRYIALELCQATLHDYVLGKCDTSIITSLEILRQATSGLAHLHSLDIVHRDIKPHNVLLSMPNSRGEIRAMISDFGLCKKLQVGRVSFSRRSGITGTDGWIAPEMLSGNERTTCAVDMFSLGCLFYHVLSDGAHPFGDALRRQANILGDFSDLGDLKGALWQVALQKLLLADLISPRPLERPPCAAVLAHPMFWNNTTILAFFQDVSDRIEKAELDDPVLKTLERGGEYVVRGDWRQHIHDEVSKDLRKYRSYRGESVRDLLRALRNKKHHYRELTIEAQQLLGGVPDEFTNYWTFRFPLLLVHTWLSMQIVANETTFRNYYHSTHRYSLSNYTDSEGILYPIYSSDINEFITKPPEKNTYTELQQVLKKKSENVQEDLAKKNPRTSTFDRKFKQRPNYLRTVNFDEAVNDTNLANDRITQNVGLYRNSNPKIAERLLNKNRHNPTFPTNGINTEEESKRINFDVEETDDATEQELNLGATGLASNFVKQRRYNKKKWHKKPDEPLIWSLTSESQNQ